MRKTKNRRPKIKALALSIAVFLGIILIFQSARAKERTEDTFFQANKFYSQGEYQKAVSLYEEIIASGVKAGNVYYNLGNSYFKLSRKGKAILNYERALRLIPYDEDLSANLEFVRSALAEVQPEKKLKWFENIYVSFRDIMPANGWSIFLLASYLLLFSVITLSVFITGLRKAARGLMVFSSILVVLSFVFMAGKGYDTESNKEGVVVAEGVDVRYSPSFSGTVAFELHEGIRVSIIRCEGDWCQIRLSMDKSGWVEKDAVEEI